MPTPTPPRPRGARSTPAGEHRPVLPDEVLDALRPRPGETAVDCTLGFAGHSRLIAARLGPAGRLIALDRDADTLPRARELLAGVPARVSVVASNFAALPKVLAAEGVASANALLADLGMSSMQVDAPDRGFSYMRDGPLDMRMDRTRGKTAAEWLAAVSADELARVLSGYGDEPDAERIAAALVSARQVNPLLRTGDVVRVIAALPPARPVRRRPDGHKALHPAARTFQALRIAVNRELDALSELLRVLPAVLSPGGRAAIISFHSGEDRLVKEAFAAGLRAGVYSEAGDDPVRAGPEEAAANPRSRSAKLRWAVRSRE